MSKITRAQRAAGKAGVGTKHVSGAERNFKKGNPAADSVLDVKFSKDEYGSDVSGKVMPKGEKRFNKLADKWNESKEKVDEEYMDYKKANKPTYTLTTSEDDGETNSSSTVTTSNPDALMVILKNAGMGGEEMDHGHDEMEMGDEGMDVQIEPMDDVSCDMGGDDMHSLLRIMDQGGREEEVEVEEETEYDNEPDPRSIDPSAFSKPRNTAKLRHDVASPGDNKLALEADDELAESLAKAWKKDKLNENIESHFSHGEMDKMHLMADGKMGVDDDYDLWLKMFDYFAPEMPYGTQKARTGDPYQWIENKLDQEFNSNKAVGRSSSELDLDVEPRLPYRDD